MSDSTVLTEADDIDSSLIEDLNPAYRFPVLRHNFYRITTMYQYHQFVSDTCAANQARYIVKRAPVDKHLYWLLEKRLGTWEKAPKSIEEKEACCKLPRAERFWRERARVSGDDSVAESGLQSTDADITISRCVEEFGFTQNDFVNADGSTLAVVTNQPVTDSVSAEQQATNEAEQARLFGESRVRTGLGGVSGGESGENFDADGDVTMG
ncbi:hypothetical protein BOTCAL_0254g00020 [Botryotinia calthae]|uniref:Uncharacterized protein n=1 Tax=Botryotinia calthae TaxID=38488 RepID=A0A4Y8CWD2_9HELO|nr:hypothetical protein BOTCAL_0254g00020 [Botryotinia calthae]